MAVYTVHSQGREPLLRARAVFLREGFSWGAFLFGPLWLLAHRLWLATLVWGLVAVAFCGLVLLLSPFASIAVAFFIQLLLGLEANHLRRLAFARRGFDLDVVASPSRAAAEAAFFGRDPQPPRSASLEHWPPRAAAAGSGVLGLFPEREAPR